MRDIYLTQSSIIGKDLCNQPKIVGKLGDVLAVAVINPYIIRLLTGDHSSTVIKCEMVACGNSSRKSMYCNNLSQNTYWTSKPLCCQS